MHLALKQAFTFLRFQVFFAHLVKHARHPATTRALQTLFRFADPRSLLAGLHHQQSHIALCRQQQAILSLVQRRGVDD